MKNLTVFCSVYVTKDYSIFKTLQGNREPKNAHVKRIAKSMQEKQLLVPVIVNENFELIDGQHRFLACKSLGLPVYFIVQEGYNIPEVQRINTASSNWGSANFVQSYIDLGNENYILFKQFQDIFELPVSCTLMLMGIETQTAKVGFKNGLFSIQKAGIDRAEAVAGWIKKLMPIYIGAVKASFAKAMLYAYENKDFKFEVFLRKLEICPEPLQDCASVVQYKKMVERVYNYHSTLQNRIIL